MKQIYLHEFNVPTNNTIYLPYSSGLLQAYSHNNAVVRNHYEFMPFLFIRDSVDNILTNYDKPYIAGFSVSVWNYKLSLKIAEAIKYKYPSCVIVFGGPHVELHPEKFFEENKFVDIAVFGEGEQTFLQILIDLVDGKTFHHIGLRNTEFNKDLDIFPSPYSKDMFKDILKKHPDIEFKAIIETNRSCPFSCSFCFWGQSSLINKMSYHTIDYIKEEAEWIGQNKLIYIFCADANFGMFKRDVDIAKIYSQTKKKYDYPEKFRVCYGKNATDSIYETAKILSKADLAKTVTLAIQSNDKNVLKTINRSNIKKETYDNLQKKYAKANIPTYTEFILGLPNETYDSFISGLETTLSAIKNNQIFIYHCQILPNTDLANPEYVNKHGLVWVEIPLAEVHGSYREDFLIQEYEKIVIQTNTMNEEEWKKCAVISWIVQLFHGLKIGYDLTEWLVKKYSIKYMDFYTFLSNWDNKIILNFWKIANDIIHGNMRCQTDKNFGMIYYEPEELSFLHIICDKEKFYQELFNITRQYLKNQNYEYDTKLVTIIDNQINILPNPKDFDNTEKLATEVILHGRKSNTVTTQDILTRPDAPLLFPFS